MLFQQRHMCFPVGLAHEGQDMQVMAVIIVVDVRAAHKGRGLLERVEHFIRAIGALGVAEIPAAGYRRALKTLQQTQDFLHTRAIAGTAVDLLEAVILKEIFKRHVHIMRACELDQRRVKLIHLASDFLGIPVIDGRILVGVNHHMPRAQQRRRLERAPHLRTEYLNRCAIIAVIRRVRLLDEQAGLLDDFPLAQGVFPPVAALIIAHIVQTVEARVRAQLHRFLSRAQSAVALLHHIAQINAQFHGLHPFLSNYMIQSSMRTFMCSARSIQLFSFSRSAALTAA